MLETAERGRGLELACSIVGLYSRCDAKMSRKNLF